MADVLKKAPSLDLIFFLFIFVYIIWYFMQMKTSGQYRVEKNNTRKLTVIPNSNAMIGQNSSVDWLILLNNSMYMHLEWY